jgi:phage shock protein A
MGIFSRFTDIVNANINSILDKAENPEKIIRLMIQEMEDTLVEVRSAAARSIADRKESQRTLTTLEREAKEWHLKAELAVDKGREDLAKAALVEKSQALGVADALRAELTELDQVIDKLSDDIARLEAKLADARSRQQALIARHETASRRLEVRKKIHDYRIDDALVRFDHYERRMDDIEGRVEAYDLGARNDLRQEFSDLAASDAVEEELRNIKQQRENRAGDGSSNNG